MLVLFETPAGFALFKVNDESKLKKPDNLIEEFQSIDKAKKMYEFNFSSNNKLIIQMVLLVSRICQQR